VTARPPRIVLAYSGSGDTSQAIAWLKEQHHADVIALTLDLGQGRDLETVRDRALALGAVRAHVLDVRDEFAREFVLPSLKADALGDGRLVLAEALARPLVARKLAAIAEIEQAASVAHGAADAGGASSSALDRLIADAQSGLRVITVPTAADAEGDWRVGANLWGRSIRSMGAPPERAFTLTRPKGECPAESAHVEIAFERGVPKAINGVFMPMLELVGSLGTIAGAHGVGRVTAPSGTCEAPAAVLLHTAHQQLQSRVDGGGDLSAFFRHVSERYADIIRDGRWFTPLREALDAFVEKVQERVTGTVRLTLSRGELTQS
jgi:argininosuccinate synthase